MIKLVLTDMDDTLIPAGHDGASDYAIEGIHAMQEAGLHFGPVSGRQPSAMGWMFRNRAECFSTGATTTPSCVWPITSSKRPTIPI